MRLDQYIFEAVKGHTLEKPQDLVGIIYHVDGCMKLMMMREELADGLERLIKRGRIAEIPRHRFYEVTDSSAPRTFSGLTDAEHSRAEKAYVKWFAQEYRKLRKNDASS